MSGEATFLVVIVVIVLIAFGVIQASRYRHRIKRAILQQVQQLQQLNFGPEARRRQAHEPGQRSTESEPMAPATEEKTKAELKRLQKVIEDRKQVASDTDISYHLWGLYKSLVRYTRPNSMERYTQDGEWYDVEILQANAQDGLNKIEFELTGDRYKFVNDEENQGWSDNVKYFSLFLYDASDRCLIEIPMRVKVDRWGRNYSIPSGGPKAFLPGDWVHELVNVKLKHQSIRNREIRAQKHQERLSEIEDLKKKFGISD